MAVEGKLNPKDVIAQAQAEGTFYPINSMWRKLFIFAGVLTCLLILTIPLGIWIIHVARKGGLGTTAEGFGFKGIGSAGWRWDAVTEFKPQSRAHMNVGGGLLGAAVGVAVSHAVAKRTPGLKGPLHYKVKGSRGWKIIPAHTLDNSGEMARAMERATGLTILPPEEPAPADSGARAG